MAGTKLDFEHRGIIAIIFLSLFGFFFLILGIVFTALGYTGNYMLFRSMGPAMAGIALVLIFVTAWLGYKVHSIRTKKMWERQRQMAILQKASTLRQRQVQYAREEAMYEAANTVPGHYAYASDEPMGMQGPSGLTNPGYNKSDSHMDTRTSASSFPQQPHTSSSSYPPPQQYYPSSQQTPSSKTIPTHHQRAPSPAGYSAYPSGVAATPSGYSAHPGGYIASPESHDSSHSSLVGVPDMGMNARASPVGVQQVILSAPALETARPKRPTASRSKAPAAAGAAYPQ